MGSWAHQDMEVDPLTVFLARGEQDGFIITVSGKSVIGEGSFSPMPAQ